MTRIVCLIPAHNEASCIAHTIQSAMKQTRPFDLIVVVPNGCTDDTANVARQFPVEVFELGKLEHRKTEALNLAWNEYCKDADLVVTIDADTELDTHAVEQWISEFEADPMLGGSQGRFTMRLATAYKTVDEPGLNHRLAAFLHPDGRRPPLRSLCTDKQRQWGTRVLVRLQRSEYAYGIDIALRRKESLILAGASSCYLNRALYRVMELDDRPGPYSYQSAVEDYELTYQLRRLKFRTIASKQVRAWTDPMQNMQALHGQRMKWQVGTITDLLRFGVNKYTWRSWGQQMMGLGLVLVNLLWVVLMTRAIILGAPVFAVSWWLVIPVVSAATSIKTVNRVPGRDWVDFLRGVTLLTDTVYGGILTWWLLVAWISFFWNKIRKTKKDMWEAQGIAEGIYQKSVVDSSLTVAVDFESR